jgi:ABC-type polysaccharide/polyol phosphate transport system ATPase subunit
MAAAVARVRRRERRPAEEIWSLRDVTLQVEEGAALGIVGRNGAGKSTLLKVIDNITAPTEGVCRTRGRIGSLLEVGTGFHKELTGRENAYLNGAILGMTRAEVRDRLDEIVAFAGLEGFMDTPVKRYSSGMYLRLGFSVAAHMEADILLVDEVLAVGDAEFQRRCLGKMDEVERSGRTVLFVSHSQDAIARLCERSVWLDHGQVRMAGPTDAVLRAYHSSGTQGATVELEERSGASAQLVKASVVDHTSTSQDVFPLDEEPRIVLELAVREPVPGLDVSVIVANARGVGVLDLAMTDSCRPALEHPGRYVVECRLPPVLIPDEYRISIWVGSKYETIELLDDVLTFLIDGEERDRRRMVRAEAEWASRRIDDHLRDAGSTSGTGG